VLNQLQTKDIFLPFKAAERLIQSPFPASEANLRAASESLWLPGRANPAIGIAEGCPSIFVGAAQFFSSQRPFGLREHFVKPEKAGDQKSHHGDRNEHRVPARAQNLLLHHCPPQGWASMRAFSWSQCGYRQELETP
jgi:hypothetical protein